MFRNSGAWRGLPEITSSIFPVVLFACVFGHSDVFASGGLPPVEFLHGDLHSDQATFTLRWSEGPADGNYDFAKVEMQSANDGSDWHPHFRYASEIRLKLWEPGTYRFRVSACRREAGKHRCGSASEFVDVVISEQVSATRPVQLHSELPGADTIFTSNFSLASNGGAAVIRPGQYESRVTDNTGWFLFWANDLRLTETNKRFSNANNLVLLWLTYRDFAGADPAPGEENLQPVWLTGWLDSDDYEEAIFDGSLMETTVGPNGKVETSTVGNVIVDARNSFQNPTVTWKIPDGSYYEGAVRSVVDPLAWDPNADYWDDENIVTVGPNALDHFSGWWASPTTNRFGMQLFTSGDYESNAITFFGPAGEPIWAVDLDWGSPRTPSLTEHCHALLTDAWYPDSAYPERKGDSFQSLCGSKGWSARRTLGPVGPTPADPGAVALDIEVPETVRGVPFGYNYGTAEEPAPIEKLVHHHDAFYYIDGQKNPTECEIGGGECELSLTWFSDGYYPDATLYRTRKSNNKWVEPLEISGWQEVDSAGAPIFAVEDVSHSIGSAGSYRFELRRNDFDSKLLGLSPTLDVIQAGRPETPPQQPPGGNPETPEPPDPDPGFNEDYDSTRIGATPGDFQVDEVGTAHYRIPIMTAQGSGGVAPEVSLSYASNRGAGVAGPGWAIEGPTSITRCGRTIEQGDGESRSIQLDDGDRFCFGGQRLMLIDGPHSYGEPGSVYRLEHDDFTRITAKGRVGDGPAWFKVERKDGSVSEYGAPSTDHSARVTALRRAGGDKPADQVVFTWPISRFEDSAGNYIEYEYLQVAPDDPSRVEWHIDQIAYTGNRRAGTEPYAAIEFAYEDAPPAQNRFGFVAGLRTTQTKRLTHIDSDSDQGLLRQYRLEYKALYLGYDGQYSVRPNAGSVTPLESIQECWGPESSDSAGETCFEPTTFDWTPGAVEVSGTDEGNGSPFKPGSRELEEVVSAFGIDLVGNGREEVAYIVDEANDPYKIGALVGRESGKLLPGGNAVGHTELLLSVSDTCAIDTPEELGNIQSIDLTGNGRQEPLIWFDCGEESAESGIYIAKWSDSANGNGNGNGGNPLTGAFDELVKIAELPTLSNVTDEWSNPQLRVVDWTGDGLSDLLLVDNEVGFIYGERDDVVWVAPNITSRATSPDGSALGAWQTVDGLFDQWLDPDSVDLCEGDTGGEIVVTFGATRQPLVSVDTGGEAGAILKVRVAQDCGDILSSQRSSRATGGRVSGPEFDELFEQEEAVERAMHIYRIANNGNDLEMQRYAQIDARKIDRVLPADLTGDGHTDFVILSLNKKGETIEDYTFDVSTRLNTGRGLLPRQSEHTDLEDAELRLSARTLDYFGDGRQSLLIPEKEEGKTVWRVYQPVFENGEFRLSRRMTTSDMPTGDLAEELNVFAGITANGWPALVQFGPDPNDNGNTPPGGVGPPVKWTYTTHYAGVGDCFNQCSTSLQRLSKITDGFGAMTSIEYGAISQARVHTPAASVENTGDYGLGSVVYPLNAPMYVVTASESLAPRHEHLDVPLGDTGAEERGIRFLDDAVTRIEYHYAGALLQGGGRGFLGFEQVTSFDLQSRILTRTRYKQNFPFTGRPESTESWYWKESASPWPENDMGRQGLNLNEDNAVLLGEAFSTWRDHWAGHPQRPADGIHHVYRSRSEEWNYVPAHNAQGEIADAVKTHRVVSTTRDVDSFGNPERATKVTYDASGNEVARQETANDYENDESRWHLGRLTCATVTSERPGVDTKIRRSRYEYDDATGILRQEVVDPQSCQFNGDAGRVTTYGLDDFGNRERAAIDGRGLQSIRTSRSEYDQYGRFVNRESIWLNGHWLPAKQVLQRDRYGNATHVRDGQGVESWHYFDSMGREHYSYTATGAWSRVRYSETIDDCPAGTRYKEEHLEAGQAKSEICRDVLGRKVRTRSLSLQEGGWVHVDTYYDHASRVVAVSEPAFDFDEAQMYFSRTQFGPDGRKLAVQRPSLAGSFAGPIERWTYNGLSTTRENELGQTVVEKRNPMGETVSEERSPDGGETTFDYDALGQLRFTDGPLAGTGDRIEIQYDALGNKRKMIDPAKGTWTYRHNGLDELVCQVDARGNGTRIEYDGAGRRTRRVDQSGVASLDSCAGTMTTQTEWTYGDETYDYQVDGDNAYRDGVASFGQVIVETTLDGDLTTIKRHWYDEFGRRWATRTKIDEDGEPEHVYEERTTFDQHGRVFQSFDASGGNRGVRHVYNERGHLEALKEAREGHAGQVYWEVEKTDARGNVTRGVMGNGMTVTADYNAATGELDTRTDLSEHAEAQMLVLHWDDYNRLTSRVDNRPGHYYQERFQYDGQNRLETIDSRESTSAGWTTADSLSFDVAGNITSRSEVGAYNYDGAIPHRLNGAGDRTFEHDANGNVIADAVNGTTDREFTYTGYDKLRRISRDSAAASFYYGPDRSRVLRRDEEGGTVSRRTHYVSRVEIVYEGATADPEAGTYRRYIGGVALVTFAAESGDSQVRYQHKDHLGSLVALSDAHGRVVARMGFGPWGQRRDVNAPEPAWRQWTQPVTPAFAEAMLGITPRGFTGHEHLDQFGIVHMNGRIYDPQLGRFLQADPFVEDTGTLNRYAYVLNNPLALSDPSGYMSVGDWIRTALVVVISVSTGYAAVAAGGTEGLMMVAAGGAMAGMTDPAGAEGALWGAFSAMVFYGIGQAIPGSAKAGEGVFGSTLKPGELIAASLSHGAAAGTIAELRGGKFGHAFAAAGVTKLFSPAIQHGLDGNEFAQVAVAATLGGTVSNATGGKFANGAVTSAMAYAFNQALSEELSRGLKVKSTLEQIEQLSSDDLEILYERNFTDDDTLIFKENLRKQIQVDYFSDTSSLREAAMNIVEAEYRSAGIGHARGLSRRAVTRAISAKLSIPEGYIKQTLRAERVIQEVNSIEPTLKGVVEGLRQGNKEVLRVWNDY